MMQVGIQYYTYIVYVLNSYIRIYNTEYCVKKKTKKWVFINVKKRFKVSRFCKIFHTSNTTYNM